MTQSVTRSTNAEILSSAYEALARGDVPAVFAVLSEDVDWHIGGRSPVSADYHGHDEVLGFFQALGERTNGTFSVEIHEILDGGGDTVAALLTEHGERNGVVLAEPAVHVWRFADGKATDFRAFAADDHDQDAFWS
ncbi:MAG: uncharacterized protein QOJ35_1546 [Solirubrobacteraceae bacterium]|jgi:ketosteroid isomerase-like protein|nr:uncharacterized protein [Solirubrobacteraceae bacterium]